MGSGGIGSVEALTLTRLATTAIAARLTGGSVPVEVPESRVLISPGASFVTLEVRRRLRGCIGTIEPARPLYLDVVRNAQRAMRDPRLPAVTASEWLDLDVKVSVLTTGGVLPAGSRAELLDALRPGVDGVILTDGKRRATFLPAVWVKLADPERFLAALLAKGGWPADDWPTGLVASRYTAVEYRDSAPREPLPGWSGGAPAD
jgi:AmmeMemoRadiSam system protein A